jgi:hypothetical protein
MCFKNPAAHRSSACKFSAISYQTHSLCPSPLPSHAKITCSHIVGGQPISIKLQFSWCLYILLFSYVYLSILLSVLSTTSPSVLSFFLFFFCYSIEENLPSLFNGSPLYSAPSIIIIIIIINLTILFVVSSLNIGR